MEERKPDVIKLAPPSLKAAIRRARVESAEQGEAMAELRQAELVRLELLEEAIKPVLAQVPEGKYVDGVIEFRLPPGAQLAVVEKKFQALLEERNINTFLATKDGAQRLKDVKLPGAARLFTDYKLISRTRRSLACEIFHVRPNRELAVLLRALICALQG